MGVIVDMLVIGLGVIGTIYAYLFSKEGHNVEHLIRETSKNYSINSLDVELLDGRSDSKGIEMTDSYIVNKSSKKDYDFIFIAVSSGKIDGVVRELEKKEITGSLVFACGIWEDRNYIEDIVANRGYILGYPVAGGNIKDNTLNCCVFDHFMLEDKEKADIPNYDDLVELFSDSGIELEHPHDMLEWIWLHMAINAGVVSVAGRYGDINDTSKSAEGLMDSTENLKEAIRSIRETSKIIESRGVKLKDYNNELFAYKIPTFISAPFMKRMFAKNILTRKIMTLHGNVDDLLFVCGSVYDMGKENSVEAPIFYGNFDYIMSKFK